MTFEFIRIPEVQLRRISEGHMRHIALSAGLIGLASFSCWAQTPPELTAPTFDILRFQTVQKEGARPNRQVGSRFAASVILLNTPDLPVNAQVFVAASGNDHTDQRKDKDWASSDAWRLVTNGDRPSLAPRLRMEMQGGKLEITPRRHSVWVEWKTPLP